MERDLGEGRVFLLLPAAGEGLRPDRELLEDLVTTDEPVHNELPEHLRQSQEMPRRHEVRHAAALPSSLQH